LEHVEKHVDAVMRRNMRDDLLRQHQAHKSPSILFVYEVSCSWAEVLSLVTSSILMGQGGQAWAWIWTVLAGMAEARKALKGGSSTLGLVRLFAVASTGTAMPFAFLSLLLEFTVSFPVFLALRSRSALDLARFSTPVFSVVP
jgi:hypothetical protein